MLATGGAWMSAWVPRAGGCRLRSGSAQPFGLRATLVGWSCVGLRVVLRPPLLYIRTLCAIVLYQPLQNRTLVGVVLQKLMFISTDVSIVLPGVGVKKQNSYVLHPKIKKHLICGFVTC
mgnify:CR=1 FL=1